MVKDDFKIILDILTILEREMDSHVYDPKTLTAEMFGISAARFGAIMVMLIQAGYIDGVEYTKDRDGRIFIRETKYLRLTLRGLEYLRDNI